MKLFNINNRLHTEVLEELYGKIDLQVLYQDDVIRECLLVDGHYIARTYALTYKNASALQDKDISAIDKTIQQGESIGKTFKKNGYSIFKNVIAVYTINIPWWLQVAFNTKESSAKARISEFFVRKNVEDELTLYGTIAEIYSPLFRKAEVSQSDQLQINPPLQQMPELEYRRKDKEGFHHNPIEVQWSEEFVADSKKILLLKEQIRNALNKK